MSVPLHDAKALVIDGNPLSRSIIVGQLRDAGVGTIMQCPRLADARAKLETWTFDVVICEQYFDREAATGQELLDDLRRNQLLPFYTVFVMVTSESSYSKVAEAAESALDAYLLKAKNEQLSPDCLKIKREIQKATAAAKAAA